MGYMIGAQVQSPTDAGVTPAEEVLLDRLEDTGEQQRDD